MLDSLFSDKNINDLLISAKIFTSIMWGVFCGFISYGLFHSVPTTIVAAPLMGTTLVGAFFGPHEHRKDFAIAIAAMFFCALIVAGMTRIETSTYTSFFNFLYGLFCFACIVGLIVFICWAGVAINDPSTASNGTNTNEATAEFLRRQRANGYIASIDSATIVTVSTASNGDPPPIEIVVHEEKKRKSNRKTWGPKTRHKLWFQSESKCYICHRKLKNWTGNFMHIDHIQPISQGGKDDWTNLAACCPSCNMEKRDHDHPELYS